MSLTELRNAQTKHETIEKLLNCCFDEADFESHLNLREYLEDSDFVVWQGHKILCNAMSWKQVESTLVPEEYLQEAVDLEEAIEDAKAWIRIWSNSCDELKDFIIGLPGESNIFDSELKQQQWEVIKQGEAFADLEGRIFAYKLLKGEI